MATSREWMYMHRKTNEFKNGLRLFLDHAFANKSDGDMVLCPCSNCVNRISRNRTNMHLDLLKFGFMLDYYIWVDHGEVDLNETLGNNAPESDLRIPSDGADIEMLDMLHDIHTAAAEVNSNQNREQPNEEAIKFYKLVEEAEAPLYPGSDNFSWMAFLLELYHLKCLYGGSNVYFNAQLNLLKKAFPKDNRLPESSYAAMVKIKELGLGYEKIDACSNDCILYSGAYKDLQECPTCHKSRWKVKKNDDALDTYEKKKVPNKVLRYFPLIPRLQRLFMTRGVAKDMRWHHECRTKDEIVRHPADTLAWKKLDDVDSQFTLECRNVRLGLASDGFNPFGNYGSQHSIWPVIMMVYNLPPWMCMRQPYMFMSLLIPGPYSPGNDIDVYLQPLIDELQLLWSVGVKTYDAYLGNNFTMRAALLWTISDFPAYAMLSGWSTKGKLACPCCHKNTDSRRLKFGKKQCYMASRRSLPRNHTMRKNKKDFDGTSEPRDAPVEPSGEEISFELSNLPRVIFGKEVAKKGRRGKLLYNWKKRSIFFDLPYWSKLLIRNNIDVMHTEKHIGESMIGTVMNNDVKTKDGYKARMDLKEMNIRPELHPKIVDNHIIIPPARFAMSKVERKQFCEMIRDIKFPDGFGSNLSRCVDIKDGSLRGLKSHDYHVLIQHVLPVLIRGFLPDDVCQPIIEVCYIMSDLCVKESNPETLQQLIRQVPFTLCKLEKLFPPAFFDIMVHLLIHLPSQALYAGNVHFRWMYPVERYLGNLKGYIHNKARIEGSIAEGYVNEECAIFCARYMKETSSKLHRRSDRIMNSNNQIVDEYSVFRQNGTTRGVGHLKVLSVNEYMLAHVYILNNCDEITEDVEVHKALLMSQGSRNVDKDHYEQFEEWFKRRVDELRYRHLATNSLVQLALGPNKRCFTHNTWYVNGYKFRTYFSEAFLKTQNSGLCVKSDSSGGEISYYGRILQIIQLEYGPGMIVTLFECEWFDVLTPGRGIIVDKYSIVSLNLKRKLKTNEPYILASQATQVFYIKDSVKHPNGDWYTVRNFSPRDRFKLGEQVTEEVIDGEAYQAENILPSIIEEETYVESLLHEDVSHIEVSDLNIDPLSNISVEYDSSEDSDDDDSNDEDFNDEVQFSISDNEDDGDNEDDII